MKLGDFEKLHFIGAGGTGVSALMRMAMDEGVTVSGSDIRFNENMKKLSELGADVYAGLRLDKIKEADAVVYSSAIKRDNPELKRARELNVPTYERHEFLGLAASGFDVVAAVSGTHGKTTVTAMLAHILSEMNVSFTALIGGDSVEFGNYVRRDFGGKKILLTEACEYKRGFLSLKPDVALVLNAEADHPDCYKDADDVADAFAKFCAQSRVAVITDEAASVLKGFICKNAHMTIKESDNRKQINRYVNLLTCGYEGGYPTGGIKVFSNAGVYIADNINTSADKCAFDVRFNEREIEGHRKKLTLPAKWLRRFVAAANKNKRNEEYYSPRKRPDRVKENEIKYTYIRRDVESGTYVDIADDNTGAADMGRAELTAEGRYNVKNALCAIAAACELGADKERVCAYISGFKGVRRRFEHTGNIDGVQTVFDYAHHPTEIKCALDTASAYGRVLAVFQPHTYSRTARYMADFVKALLRADGLILMTTFAAREAPSDGEDEKELFRQLATYGGGEKRLARDKEDAIAAVKEMCRGYDIVLFLGAGDIYDFKRECTPD